MEKPSRPERLSELMAEWRAAGRDVKAAEAAATIADHALEAARAAEESAKAAAESVELALAAAQSASTAANQAAQAARTFLVTAEGDEARAREEVDRAGQSEVDSGKRFHDAQDVKFRKDAGGSESIKKNGGDTKVDDQTRD
jgi:hypothetical protein